MLWAEVSERFIEGVEKECLKKRSKANLQIAVDSIDSNRSSHEHVFDEQSLEELAHLSNNSV